MFALRTKPTTRWISLTCYYLPFCTVFASNDNLHERVVPLFLRDGQTFLKGQHLKADLAKLDAYYDSLPENVKSEPLYTFAAYPPSHDSFLVTELWDKHSPGWREEASKEKLTPELQQQLLNLVNKLSAESKLADSPAHRPELKDLMFIRTSRLVSPKKGKWMLVPPAR